MKLYEIDQNLRSLWDKIAEQDGEMTDEDLQALEELNLAKDEKIKGYGVLIRELQSEIAEYTAEITRIKKLVEKKVKLSDRLTERLKDFMLTNGEARYESLEVNISFRKSSSLEIAENTELPKEFIRITETPDKKAITDFIKSGGTIDGCELVEKENIQIK